MTNRPTDARRAYRAALLASVAFGVSVVVGLPQEGLAAGGTGGGYSADGIDVDGGTGGRGPDGAPGNPGGTNEDVPGAGGGGGGAGGGTGGAGSRSADADGGGIVGADGGTGGSNGFVAPGTISNTTDYIGDGEGAYDGRAGASADTKGGGGGGGGGEGGYALVIKGAGSSSNSASLTGGRGGDGGTGANGNGGDGGDGGIGAYLGANNARFTNSGTIQGGTGGSGGGVGGSESVNGGAGGIGGAGVSFAGTNGTLTNTGAITGGTGGNGAPAAMPDSSLPPLSGPIVWPVPIFGPSPALQLRAADSAMSYSTSGNTGGNGVEFLGAGGVFTNASTGRIFGGTGGDGNVAGSGGTGVYFDGRGTLTNDGGTITGGLGGRGTVYGGSGGIGVRLADGGMLTNSGIISGGDGRSSMYSSGNGGVGVYGNDLTIVNAGTIRGGAAPGNGYGGGGISGSNLTITNSGTISVGESNAMRSWFGPAAIRFFSGVNKLTMTSTSIIDGNVVAASRRDTLGLGGDTNGSFDLGQIGPGGLRFEALKAAFLPIPDALPLPDADAKYQGFGILQKTGASTWTLSGAPRPDFDAPYLLAYQVAAGTLNLGGTSQTAASLQMTGGTLANGTLTSAGAFDMQAGTVTANLAGSGALTKTTAGTVVLAGTNTYTGDTNIDGGTLQVDGVITRSNVFVNNGGTLSGIGKIGDPIINAGGTLAPGNAANPYGTLTIVGPLTFAPGSFYNVAISPSQNSRTNVVGTTTIQGGTLNVAAGSGTYAIRQYTILNATGGITGGFAGVTSTATFAFLTPSVAYDANNVYLKIAPKVATRAGTPTYTIAAATQNQFNVASGLTQAGIQSGGRGKVLTALNQLTATQARAAFDSLSGEGVTAAQNVAFRSTQLFTSAIFDQTTFYSGSSNAITLTAPQFGALAAQPIRELADLPARGFQPVAPAPASRTWRAWATGFGGVENISGNRGIGSAAQRNDIYGGALGVDYQLTPNYLVGVAVGGSNGNFQVASRGTSGSTTGGHIAVYDLYELGNWYGASSSSFSYFGNQTTRFVSGFGGLGTEQNRGNFNSNEFRSRLEIGRHFSSLPLLGGLPTIAGFGTVTPFVAIELASLRSNGFTETPLKGGPGQFRLNVSGQSTASAPGFVGLRFQSVAPLGDGMVLRPSLQLAYVHEFAPYRNQFGTLTALPGSTFLVDGARPARDAAQVKVGGELALGPRSAIFANFDSELSRINQLYAGKGGFRYIW